MIQDKKDGTYYISYIPTEAGLYSVMVQVKDQHVQVSTHTSWTLIPFSHPGSVISGGGDILGGSAVEE